MTPVQRRGALSTAGEIHDEIHLWRSLEYRQAKLLRNDNKHGISV